jgi:hypothetical protein
MFFCFVARTFFGVVAESMVKLSEKGTPEMLGIGPHKYARFKVQQT